MKEVVFFEILSERLKDENLTKLSTKIGVPKGLLFEWVKGRRMPSLRNSHYVKKLATYLGLEFEEIILGPKVDSKEKTIGSVHFSDEKREYLVKIVRVK